jgi:predicted RNA-binding Zn-ribbon protein involved in translation (DUF1610 family)
MASHMWKSWGNGAYGADLAEQYLTDSNDTTHCTSCGAVLSPDEVWAAFSGSADNGMGEEVLCEYCYDGEPQPSGSYEGPDSSDEDYWDQMLDNVEKYDPTCWE